ncbi:MAG: EF-hand domain-containing protein [bacterium]|nr:EF-hand domain-containing protein [bacterium]
MRRASFECGWAKTRARFANEFRCAQLGILLMLAAVHQGRAEVILQKVAFYGDPAPGVADAGFGAGWDLPAINNAGEVAFGARIRYLVPPFGSDLSLWKGTPGNLTLAVRTGDQAPGTPVGVTFAGTSFSGTLGLNGFDDGGRLAFSALLTGTGTLLSNDTGLWVGPPGGIELAAREGDPAPGTPVGVVFAFQFTGSDSALFNAGGLAFEADLAGPGVVPQETDDGLWSGAPGSVSLLMREGDQPPGFPAGAEFAGTTSPSLRGLNGSGQVLFYSRLEGTGVSTWDDSTLWIGPSPVLIFREGDEAPPGNPDGCAFDGVFYYPTLNGWGQTAMQTRLRDCVSGAGGPDNEELWIGSVPILREGDSAAPGMPAGTTFAGLGGTVELADSGEITFHALLAGPGIDASNDATLWAGPPGGLTLVAREGDPAPGAGGATYSTFWLPSINELGQVAFTASLSDASRGLWAGAPGNLELIVRSGDVLEVNPGVFYTVYGISLQIGTSGKNGTPRALNDLGQITFLLDLDGSADGIFLATLNPSPPIGDPRACCLPDGSCALLTVGECVSAGGLFGDQGSACLGDSNTNGVDDACESAVSGACCLGDGTCSVVTGADCAGAGGAFAGGGTACQGDGDTNGIDDACEDAATGACCLGNGTGWVRTAAGCAASAGTFQGPQTTCQGDADSNGVDDLCEATATGACCLGGGSCSVVSSSDCTTNGGDYQGDDTTCQGACAGGGGLCNGYGTDGLGTTPMCDDFQDGVIDPQIWCVDGRPFESGDTDIAIAESGGLVNLSGTAIGNYWGGKALVTVQTYNASVGQPLTFEVDRVSMSRTGSAARSGIYITTPDRSTFVFFSDNQGEGGWQVNSTSGTGGNAGPGLNIDAFDGPAFDDGGSHTVRLVADGSVVDIYLDDVYGLTAGFPVTTGILFEFGAFIRQIGDTVDADFHNVCITTGRPGDFDGDGYVDLDDYAAFFDCLGGPGNAPAPTLPTTAQDCLDAFDFDGQGNVDLLDLAEFQVAFDVL